ncbi:MAG: hypothetical protein R2932_01480 [Caldilineaceae bacterium]
MVRFYDKKRKSAGNGKRLMARTALHHWVVLIQDATPQIARGSKLHILVDKTGAPLTVLLRLPIAMTNGASKILSFPLVVKRPDSEQHFCADKAYDSADIRDFLVLEHYQPHIKRR